MKKISIVIPVYNEEENVERAYSVVTERLKKLEKGYQLEILFCDNRSTDKTWTLINQLCQKDHRIKGIRYSKNFGYQRSIYMGYLMADGDAVVQLDCDLQDDPNFIYEFVDRWNEGNKLVYGVRKTRKEGTVITFFRKMFYRLLNILSEEPFPVDAGEFRLVDRVIVEDLRKISDFQPYLRGLIFSLGYKRCGIEYNRDERTSGVSKFSVVDLLRVAFDGILNYSIIPLRVASFVGIFFSLLSLVVIMIYVVLRMFFGHEWPAGFTTLAVLVLFSIGLNSLFLGIIGEYVGRIYKQSKHSPIAIIDEKTF